MIREGDATGQAALVDSAAADALTLSKTVTIEGICIRLSVDKGVATNRLILFVNSALVLDTTDTTPEQSSPPWESMLVLSGDAGAQATFRDAVIRYVNTTRG